MEGLRNERLCLSVPLWGVERRQAYVLQVLLLQLSDLVEIQVSSQIGVDHLDIYLTLIPASGGVK